MLRRSHLAALQDAFQVHPVVTLVGPRQCGKTTLALEHARRLGRSRSVLHLDLEDPAALARLDNPVLALEDARGLVVIDEVQRRPDLFPVLRVLVDRGPRDRKFLLLGSASGQLLRQGAESLAGRSAFLELTPFSLHEGAQQRRLWLRGGYPRAYLARADADAFTWLDHYVSTFLERDIPSLGIRVPAPALRRFWLMLAHVHGQLFNASELGRAFGAKNTTIQHYLDILESAFMVRVLRPWHENLSKRQVKTPKVYFRDSGLLHLLLGLRSAAALDVHPAVGASWEGFALEEVIRALRLRPGECHFWSTHADAELDLLTFQGTRRVGYKFKRSDAPKVTKSMRVAVSDLRLDHLYVVMPGKERYPLDGRITAIGLQALIDLTAARGSSRRAPRRKSG